MITRYHKSRKITRKDRLVPRFLPDEMNEIFLKYVSVVKPVEVFFSDQVFSGESVSAFGDFCPSYIHWKYLFCKRGKRMTGECIRESFVMEMSDLIGFSLRISDYRHIISAFTKALLKHKFPKRMWNPWEDLEFSVETPLPIDLQIGHSGYFTESRYGVGANEIEG